MREPSIFSYFWWKLDKQMRITVLFFAACLGVFGCAGDGQKESSVIGGADAATTIVVSDEADADGDTVRYELPQCCLWYTEALPEKYMKKSVCIWTEYPYYWEDVQVINVFVANPTATPLSFGRGWSLLRWDGERWSQPEFKRDLSWQDDAFGVDRAPLLYCFRFPVGEYYRLTVGKYRLLKTFWQANKRIELTSEFEVRSE